MNITRTKIQRKATYKLYTDKVGQSYPAWHDYDYYCSNSYLPN